MRAGQGDAEAAATAGHGHVFQRGLVGPAQFPGDIQAQAGAVFGGGVEPVSYTHLDVYKRQAQERQLAAAREQQLQFQHQDVGGYSADEEAGQPDYQHDTARTIVREGIKVGRNDACPCGSGKKFKHCHGQLS